MKFVICELNCDVNYLVMGINRRIPLEDVPTESDEECAKWLFEHYKQKVSICDVIMMLSNLSHN